MLFICYINIVLRQFVHHFRIKIGMLDIGNNDFLGNKMNLCKK